MKRVKNKTLVLVMIAGFAGVAVMMAVIMGSGLLMSRETQTEYAVKEDFSDVALNTVAAQINVVPSDQPRVTAYAKAWLKAPIDMHDIVTVTVEDGVLNVTETPFPAEFFGLFPQPYELKITLYLPETLCGAAADGES